MPQSSAEPSKENQDLTTINYHTLNGLHEENQPKEMQSATKQGSASQEVGELIGTCVMLTRIKTTQCALSKPETEWHLCALKLLPHFFSKEELAESNTDGSYDEKCLDSTKLNSLKILVFSKFPASTSKEKDKAWRFIKGKINSKCHAASKIRMTDSCLFLMTDSYTFVVINFMRTFRLENVAFVRPAVPFVFTIIEVQNSV